AGEIRVAAVARVAAGRAVDDRAQRRLADAIVVAVHLSLVARIGANSPGAVGVGREANDATRPAVVRIVVAVHLAAVRRIAVAVRAPVVARGEGAGAAHAGGGRVGDDAEVSAGAAV